MVMGDRFLLVQALVNLIDNAVDFSATGARVEPSVRVEAGAAIVEVTDRGQGVPTRPLGQVFERFYGLAHPDGGKGSGLGLAFVGEIAALHGGRVGLANRTDGGGARATLVVPLADGHRGGPTA